MRNGATFVLMSGRDHLQDTKLPKKAPYDLSKFSDDFTPFLFDYERP